MKIVVRLFANVPMMGFIPLREIHRASECALQGLLRPIDSRGEAKLVSPRGFQKVNPLIICAIVKINSRGECHGAAWRRIEEQCDAKARGRAFRTGLCKRHGSGSDPKAVPEERSPKGRSGVLSHKSVKTRQRARQNQGKT